MSLLSMRPSRGLSAALLGALAVTWAVTSAPVHGVPAEPSTEPSAQRAGSNPLAGRPWGTYAGVGDAAWVAWSALPDGKEKTLLERIVLQPRSRWYGQWVPLDHVRESVAGSIAVAQNGNPETVAQLTVFRMVPWEERACTSLPTAAEQADYKAWIDEFVAGVGDAHAAIVLQPDGPFALCAPHGSKLYSKLIKYAAKRLGALPNASTYIDAGASDWLKEDPQRALKILLPAGVKSVRGFSLNNTHYAAVEDEIAFGAAVVKALARRGVKGMHFVVNTAANGRPFNGYDYKGKNFDNAETCKTKRQRRCVTLGIPPTADVANPAWGLPPATARLALKYADGYVWVGRPWLYNQADPFDMQRALDVSRTTPFQ
jgi:endoglucanase